MPPRRALLLFHHVFLCGFDFSDHGRSLRSSRSPTRKPSPCWTACTGRFSACTPPLPSSSRPPRWTSSCPRALDKSTRCEMTQQHCCSICFRDCCVKKSPLCMMIPFWMRHLLQPFKKMNATIHGPGLFLIDQKLNQRFTGTPPRCTSSQSVV